MDQRVSLITVPVSDRARSRSFYVDGLGWDPLIDVEDVLMFRVGDRIVLSLWDLESFTAEVGAPRTGAGVTPLTIAHNVASDAAVDDVLRTAGDAGAQEVWPAQRREWGGYSGYFADPDGYRWEVAHTGSEGPLAFLVPGLLTASDDAT